MGLPRTLVIELLSDATFGRGEGTAGEVDVEVEHDDLGLPFLGGKTLHGLLREAWLTMAPCFQEELGEAARRLLGPERDLEETAVLRIGDAVVAEEVRGWVEDAVHRAYHALPPEAVLRGFTDVRRQTAVERETGAPARTTLRSSRVVLRGLRLEAPLEWLPGASDLEARCLALCALGVRHAGLGRHRGRGHLRVTLEGSPEETRRRAGLEAGAKEGER